MVARPGIIVGNIFEKGFNARARTDGVELIVHMFGSRRGSHVRSMGQGGQSRKLGCGFMAYSYLVVNSRRN